MDPRLWHLLGKVAFWGYLDVKEVDSETHLSKRMLSIKWGMSSSCSRDSGTAQEERRKSRTQERPFCSEWGWETGALCMTDPLERGRGSLS